MAIDYSLVVSGSAPRRKLIARMGFTRDRFDRSEDVWRGRFDELGLDIALRSGRHGHWDCGARGFRADRYLEVAFRLDTSASVEHVAALVDRVLVTGDEPLAVIALGSVLVLQRNGKVRRYEATWPARTDPTRALSARAERIVFDEFLLQYHANTVVALDDRVLAEADGTATNWVGDHGAETARAAARLLLEIATDHAHPLRSELEDIADLSWFSGELAPLGLALATRVADRVVALVP
jgi:hypothetical protein